MTDGLKAKHRNAIIDALSVNDRVDRIVLFGSRAQQAYQATSDIDIALFGNRLTYLDLGRLAQSIDELPYPHTVDLLLYDKLKNDSLRREIDLHGVEWFSRKNAAVCVNR